MASAPRLREFLVIVPDKPGVKDKRLEVRPYVPPSIHHPQRHNRSPYYRMALMTRVDRTHLKNMTPRIESGDWKMGGASPPVP